MTSAYKLRMAGLACRLFRSANGGRFLSTVSRDPSDLRGHIDAISAGHCRLLQALGIDTGPLRKTV